jgi:hypothetical protein
MKSRFELKNFLSKKPEPETQSSSMNKSKSRLANKYQYIRWCLELSFSLELSIRGDI